MSTENKRILIAEDNQVMADVVRFNLERAGYQVTVTNTGKQAFDTLQNDCFDLLITDFQMPEMNGDELCRELRNDDRHADMKIILCSAKGYELDIDHLQDELDISKIIFKPFSPMQMKQTVSGILDSETVSL